MGLSIGRTTTVVMAMAAAMLLPVSVASCGGSTPAGVVGTVDLRQHLPASLAARAALESGEPHETHFEVGQPAARVALRWATLRDGACQYLLTVELEVLRPAPGVRIIGPNALTPVTERHAGAVIESVPVQVEWIRRGLSLSSSGSVVYLLDGAGQSHRR